MKTVGIVVDNYKLDYFKKELKGYEFTVHDYPLTEGSETSLIKVKTTPDKEKDIQAICKKCMAYFNRLN